MAFRFCTFAVLMSTFGSPTARRQSATSLQSFIAEPQLFNIYDETFLTASAASPAWFESEDERPERIEQHLKPIFATLPLNKQGRLDSAALRYLLNRHFMHQHGWLLHGLASDDVWNTSFPLTILTQQRMQLQLERLLLNEGVSLRGAANLVRILKKQVQADAVDRLRFIWRAHQLTPRDKASLQVMDSILDTHTALSLQGWQDRTRDWQFDISRVRKEIREDYPSWPRAQVFLREALEDIDGTAVSFDTAQSMVLRVLNRFGHLQDKECDQLKYRLVQLEGPRPGRVELARFYGQALKNGELWLETKSYLRQLGALDESDPFHPAVLIPNYVSSASNHLGDSRYFDLACIDECQELLGQMERRIGASEATAAQISEVALRLPSPSHPERDHIPNDLLHKLDDIAASHGGKVPLHGRLFAQWLHHLYPRDCLYPHLAGSTKQEQPNVYEDRTRLPAAETNESLIKLLGLLTNSPVIQTTTSLPWDLHEELIEPPKPKTSEFPTAKKPVKKGLALSPALAAVAAGALLVISASAGRLPLRTNRRVGSIGSARLLDADGSLRTAQAAASECAGAADTAVAAEAAAS